MRSSSYHCLSELVQLRYSSIIMSSIMRCIAEHNVLHFPKSPCTMESCLKTLQAAVCVFWLTCTHLINRLVGRELYKFFILMWCSAIMLYFIWLFFPTQIQIWSRICLSWNINLSYPIIMLLFSSRQSFSLQQLRIRHSLYLLLLMVVELFWILACCIVR